MNIIKQTSPDKVHGKLEKYKQGDLLSIDCQNGNFLAALISKKFNAYYDITLIEFYQPHKPELNDFTNGKFFGTRFGSWEELTYAVDRCMIQCKYIDNNPSIEKASQIQLSSAITQSGYCYLNTIQELLGYYLVELPIRIEKSRNAEKFPDLAFVSKHLVEMKHIIE